MHWTAERGVTLIELTIAVILIAILATMSSYFVGDQVSSTRYENTRAKMDAIRTAILGNSGISSEGRRTKFGFHGDMGRLPSSLGELTARGAQTAWAYDATLGMGAGWRGPYYNQKFTAEDDITKDEWGTAFVLNTGAAPPFLKSYGSDRVSGGTVFAKDLIMTFTTDSRQASTVQGFILNGSYSQSGATVSLSFSSNGSIVSSSTSSASNGSFSFSDIPFGVASIQVTSSPTISPKVINIENAQTIVPIAVLNYSKVATVGEAIQNGIVLNMDAAYSKGLSPASNGCAAADLGWVDLSPSGLSGTLTNFGGCGTSTGWNGNGTPNISGTTGPYRLTYDGSDDYVVISGGPAALSGTNARTVALWLNTSVSGSMGFFDSGDSGVNYKNMQLYTTPSGVVAGAPPSDPGGLYLSFYNNDIYLPIGPISNGVWHYVAATLNNAFAAIYLDGALNNSAYHWNGASWSTSSQPVKLANPPDTTKNPVWIGKTRSALGGGSAQFTGHIANVHIYSRVLSQEEISQNCKASRARFLNATCQ